MAVVVAGVAVAGALLSREGGHGGPRPVPTPPPTTVPAPIIPSAAVKLVTADDHALAMIDLGRGTVRPIPFPDPAGAVSQPPIVLRDASVVVVIERGVAWSIHPGGGRPPIRLGAADAVVPADAGFVLLIDFGADTSTRVGDDGGPAGDVAPVPDGTWWATPINGGFLLSSHERWLHVARDGRILADRGGSVLASGDDEVAWIEQPCGGPECRIHVTDMAWEQDRTLVLPATDFTFVSDAQLSPNGRWLVLAGDLAGSRSAYEVGLVDLDEAQLSMEVVGESLESPALVLSAVDEWVFWTARRLGTSETSFTAYDIGAGRASEVDLPVRNVVAFSAF